MKKIIVILMMLMMAGCSLISDPKDPATDPFDADKLSFDEFDELYGQMMYEGLPEDRTNLTLGNANGVWKYNLKIRNDNSDGESYDELGYAEMSVSNDADPPIKIVLHPRIANQGSDVFALTDESVGYEPFTGGMNEKKELMLTGNDCILYVERYYLWNGKEYLFGIIWFSEEKFGDFMMIREHTSSGK